MKILYANGDSWTYGQEIPTSHPASLCHTDQYYGSWPYHLATLMGTVCVNEAAGGGSNDRIFRKTTEFINEYCATGRNPRDLTIVLGWTTPERTEIESDGVYVRVNSNGIITKTTSTTPPDHHRYLEDYATSYFEVVDLAMLLEKQARYMLTLRTLTTALGIQYYDFQAIGSQPIITHQAINVKYNQTITNFYPQSWIEYCGQTNQPLYPHRHPTPVAHQNWANLLHEWITK